MSKYLVVAHQTADSPELLERLRELDDPAASFTLIVPATKATHLLTWTEGEARAVAESVPQEGRELWERNGLRVNDTSVGDESPLQAISDALVSGHQYKAIVVSTLPPGVSRWVKLDVHNRASKFGVPVISVIAPHTT